MGHRELIETLRREGDEQAAAMRRAAGQEAAELRAAAEERLQELETACDQRCRQLCEASRRAIMAEAERNAALNRLQAEDRLAGRLRRRAQADLAALRSRPGHDLLHGLADELPDEAWRSVRVHPGDAAAAAERFPDAEIRPDPAVSGGLAVMSADGSLEVVNTLEARLERFWPELLPQILTLAGRRQP